MSYEQAVRTTAIPAGPNDSTIVLGIWLANALTFSSFWVLMTLFPNRTATTAPATTFIGLAALNLALLLVCFSNPYEVSNLGLRFSDLIARDRRMRWAEIDYLGYEPGARRFILGAGPGKTLRTSARLAGSADFARLALAKLPLSAMTPGALFALRQLAAGADAPRRPRASAALALYRDPRRAGVYRFARAACAAARRAIGVR